METPAFVFKLLLIQRFLSFVKASESYHDALGVVRSILSQNNRSMVFSEIIKNAKDILMFFFFFAPPKPSAMSPKRLPKIYSGFLGVFLFLFLNLISRLTVFLCKNANFRLLVLSLLLVFLLFLVGKMYKLGRISWSYDNTIVSGHL